MVSQSLRRGSGPTARGLHNQPLGCSWPAVGVGFMANCSRGFIGSYYGGFMNSPSHRVHGWLLGRGSQPVASRYSDELALFIIVIKNSRGRGLVILEMSPSLSLNFLFCGYLCMKLTDLKP